MESIEELNRLSERIDDFKENVKGEQETKMSFIYSLYTSFGI